ncbi:PREDICTED: uncharacterized protein LOC104569172, partial [Tinamus guttatus]|uniref:uncharacterized protein LOC104569172 n=1 Tax=Tinamus guttatus TaxID=94827 RepID=UPI00052F2834
FPPQTAYQTELGQALDLITAPVNQVDLSRFSEQRYKAIVKYKTAFYSFYLPVAAAMYMAGIDSEEEHANAKAILLEMGEFFQVQDDYLDCFGDPEVTGKVGTDIQDNKCSWLVVECLRRVTPEQRRILEENYGRKEPEKVAKVKELYEAVGMRAAFQEYEERSYARLQALVAQHARRGPVSSRCGCRARGLGATITMLAPTKGLLCNLNHIHLQHISLGLHLSRHPELQERPGSPAGLLGASRASSRSVEPPWPLARAALGAARPLPPVSQTQLGDSWLSPDVGYLLLHTLCPALCALVEDGLKPFQKDVITGQRRTSPWSVVEASVEPVRALCDHAGAGAGQLSFRKGDVLQLLCTVDEDWIRCGRAGATGLVPVGYTSLVL